MKKRIIIIFLILIVCSVFFFNKDFIMKNIKKMTADVTKTESISEENNYTPVTDVNFYPNSKPSGTLAAENVRDLGTLNIKVGEQGSFKTIFPSRSLTGSRCGHTVATYYPSDYYDINFTEVSEQNLVSNPEYALVELDGERFLNTTFETLKPGISSDIRISYYVNYRINPNSSNALVYCPICGMSTVTSRDINWYHYIDVFKVNIIADYKIDYDTMGGSKIFSTSRSETNTQSTLPVTGEQPTKEGYEFVEWNTKSDGTGMSYKARDSITLNWQEGYGSTVETTLYAIWEKESIDGMYTVIYKDDLDGKCFGDETHGNLKIGDSTPAFIGTPTRPGHNFLGWVPKVNPVISAEDANENYEIIYVAQWDDTINSPDEEEIKYTVIYKDEDNSFSEQATKELQEGENTPKFKEETGKTEILEDGTIIPIRGGYRFVGWSKKINKVVSAEDANVNYEIIYIARWQKMSEIADKEETSTSPSKENSNKEIVSNKNSNEIEVPLTEDKIIKYLISGIISTLLLTIIILKNKLNRVK